MNTVCKEHEWVEVEMSASYPDLEKEVVHKYRMCKFCGEIEKWNDDVKDIGKKLKIPCKEHDWAEMNFLVTGKTIIYCKICGEFKPKENLSVIEDNEWEDIWNEYQKISSWDKLFKTFLEYLKENYTVPEKK